MSVMILGYRKVKWSTSRRRLRVPMEEPPMWVPPTTRAPVFRGGAVVAKHEIIVGGYSFSKYTRLDEDLLILMQKEPSIFKFRGGKIHGLWSMRAVGVDEVAVMPMRANLPWVEYDKPYREDLGMALGFFDSEED